MMHRGAGKTTVKLRNFLCIDFAHSYVRIYGLLKNFIIMEIGFPQGLLPKRSFSSVAECFSTWCLMPTIWGEVFLTVLEVLWVMTVMLLSQNTQMFLEMRGFVSVKAP